MSAPDFVLGPLWTHDKRGGQTIMGVREFKGTRFLDLRQWVNDGATCTTKGVTIPLHCVQGFIRALIAHEADIVACGREFGS